MNNRLQTIVGLTEVNTIVDQLSHDINLIFADGIEQRILAFVVEGVDRCAAKFDENRQLEMRQRKENKKNGTIESRPNSEAT